MVRWSHSHISWSLSLFLWPYFPHECVCVFVWTHTEDTLEAEKWPVTTQWWWVTSERNTTGTHTYCKADVCVCVCMFSVLIRPWLVYLKDNDGHVRFKGEVAADHYYTHMRTHTHTIKSSDVALKDSTIVCLVKITDQTCRETENLSFWIIDKCI